jgi:hypothetical protein
MAYKNKNLWPMKKEKNYGLSRNIIKTITLFINLTYQNIVGRP